MNNGVKREIIRALANSGTKDRELTVSEIANDIEEQRQKVRYHVNQMCSNKVLKQTQEEPKKFKLRHQNSFINQDTIFLFYQNNDPTKDNQFVLLDKPEECTCKGRLKKDCVVFDRMPEKLAETIKKYLPDREEVSKEEMDMETCQEKA